MLHARSGNLLWLGALVGLWTTGSFIETIRDIIRRAYGVTYTRPFWEYRLGSIGMIIVAVMLAMIAFSVSILLLGVQQFLVNLIPGADDIVSLLTLLRIAPALMLFVSLYLLFYVLTPKRYRVTSCRKWPGAAFVTLWWVSTTALLPVALASVGGYDLTYGSLAGRDDRADFLLHHRPRSGNRRGAQRGARRNAHADRGRCRRGLARGGGRRGRAQAVEKAVHGKRGRGAEEMTGLMAGKRGLIMGLANDRSLAWGIAKALSGAGRRARFLLSGRGDGEARAAARRATWAPPS